MMSLRPPNKRLQPTRSASLRVRLNRKPIKGMSMSLKNHLAILSSLAAFLIGLTWIAGR